jgi:alanyl-tRNA synthetase
MLEIQRRLNCNEDELSDRVMQLYEDKKSLEKKIKFLIRSDESEISQWVEDSIKVNGYVVVVRRLNIGDADELKRLGDRLISNIGSGIGILFDDGGEKPAAVVVVSADLVKKELNAGKIAKEIGSFMGGGGGGKPHLATAGGKDSNAINNAMKKTEEFITNTLA